MRAMTEVQAAFSKPIHLENINGNGNTQAIMIAAKGNMINNATGSLSSSLELKVPHCRQQLSLCNSNSQSNDLVTIHQDVCDKSLSWKKAVCPRCSEGKVSEQVRARTSDYCIIGSATGSQPSSSSNQSVYERPGFGQANIPVNSSKNSLLPGSKSVREPSIVSGHTTSTDELQHLIMNVLQLQDETLKSLEYYGSPSITALLSMSADAIDNLMVPPIKDGLQPTELSLVSKEMLKQVKSFADFIVCKFGSLSLPKVLHRTQAKATKVASG